MYHLPNTMTNRLLVAYDQDYFRLKKKTFNADGQLICINCGRVLSGRRWLYCSDECSLAFYKKYVKDWGVIREEVFKRDNYTCVKCGTKAKVMEDLECDHIIPIFLGGSEFDKENLQTLCSDCHKRKTAEDRGRFGRINAEVKLGIQQQL